MVCEWSLSSFATVIQKMITHSFEDHEADVPGYLIGQTSPCDFITIHMYPVFESTKRQRNKKLIHTEIRTEYSFLIIPHNFFNSLLPVVCTHFHRWLS